jgi:hypothetical protein
MSDTTAPETPPELILLDALIETCRQTCRHNSDIGIRKAALDFESKLERDKAKIVAKLALSEEVAA